ncbi:Flavin-dependent monooxygenase, oxygenase subunit HsaA [Halioglobus japonicus]|nr:Flavin-dependent monooxygenase, oxygenase subunit HsaA [Halioglobus japonicus]
MNNPAEAAGTGAQFSMGSPRALQLLQAARDLQPVLRERAAQCKAQRKVPAETIADFHAAGFFKILQSEQYGGYEMDPQVFYAVGLELAKACMSSAWVLGVVAVHNWQMNLFDPQASVDVWGDDPTVLVSSSYAPMGMVTPVDGGFMLSGRWSFSSGCEHCQWVFLGAVIPTEEAPWDMENYSTFLLPRDDYSIEQNWDVVGLQGTGSHDIVVENVFVPEHRVHRMREDRTGEKHRSKAPLYRLPFMQVFARAVCNASLGAVEGVLENYIEVAKTRIAGPVPMKDDPSAKKVAADAKAAIEYMKLMMFTSFDTLMEAARTDNEVPVIQRALFRYETSKVADQCLALSSRMLKAAGSGAIRNNSAMLSQHQDIFASQAHIANISEPFSINLGGMLFGQNSTDLGL